MKFLEHENNFSWINISLFEIVYHLIIVKVLNKSYPPGINIKLFELGLKVTTFVDFSQENILCLLDATSRQKELDLVLRWNFNELMNLRLSDIFT